MDGLGFLLGLGQKAWSAFWVFIATVLAASTLFWNDTILSSLGFVFWTATPCLFLAFAGRFLFTGEWRGSLKEPEGESVLKPLGRLGTHEAPRDILCRTISQRRIGTKDSV